MHEGLAWRRRVGCGVVSCRVVPCLPYRVMLCVKDGEAGSEGVTGPGDDESTGPLHNVTTGVRAKAT